MCSRCGAAFFATETDPVSVYHNVVSCRARIFTVDSRDAFVGYLDEIERILGCPFAGVKHFNGHDPSVFGVIQNDSIDLKRFFDLHS